VTIEVLGADLGRGVRAGFTTRTGGLSTGPYEGLNLALHVGDDPYAVSHNRAAAADWAGARVQFPHQVHGADVLVIQADAPGDPDEEASDGRIADAVVAVGRGPAVGVLVADCVPVLLADPDAEVVAAAHAGRKGLVAGVLTAALTSMVARGARPERIRAAIGPAAGGCCYEVPAELRAEVGAVHPVAPAETSWGTPSLDLRAACAEALRAQGVAEVQVVGGCTIEDEALYSYRRSQVTGRFAGVVRML
jgi:YfiH family protein